MCICDAASNTVLWRVETKHRRFAIDAFSFSPDKSRLLLADGGGGVSIWDVSALLQHRPHSTEEDPMAQNQLDDSRAPRFLDKFYVRTLSRARVNLIAFSTDNRAVVTYDGYTPIPSPEHWPLSAQREGPPQPKQGAPAVSSEFPNYYVGFDGWIWRVDPGGGRRRVRWLPPGYRYIPAVDVQWSKSPDGWGIRGHRIALATNEGRFVLVDA